MEQEVAMTESIVELVGSVGSAVIGHHIIGEDKYGNDKKLKKPVDFTYYKASTLIGNIIGMIFICPCGCDDIKIISFGPRRGSKPVWTWNSNIERPILTPALQCVKGNCKFNLIRGVFERC